MRKKKSAAIVFLLGISIAEALALALGWLSQSQVEAAQVRRRLEAASRSEAVRCFETTSYHWGECSVLGRD